MQLLLVSLGPVQDFIASARRCQDLWFGSWLLSSLARAAARGVQRKGGQDCLIFPGRVDDEGTRPAVANKILARVEDPPSSVAEAGRQAMSDELERIMKTSFDRVAPERFHRDRAELQVRDLMEYVWVSAPIGDDGYGAARSAAERLLAARKVHRNWGPVAWGAPVPKSSLDGLRESVLDESLYDGVASGRISAETARRRYFVKPAERLCGVGLLKRVGTEPEDDAAPVRRPAFHSTSHVASAPVRARAQRMNRADALAEYERALGAKIELRAVRCGAGGLDGRALYEAQLEAILAENTPDFPPRGNERTATLDPLRKSLRACLGELGLNADAVPAYYAVLLADGDFMGRTLDQVGDRQGAEGQQRVSAALDRFSAMCRGVVDDHEGSLVYSGGDDVLALLPVHTVLACARKLNSLFREELASALVGLQVDPMPSLSVGIGISHHLDDMADARQLAKQAEVRAKSLPGKDALALVAQLRSGGRIEAAGCFGGSRPLDVRLADWVGHRLRDEIPGKAAHDLAAQLAPLMLGSATVDAGIFRSLARRVFGRKQAGHGDHSLPPDVAEKLDDASLGGRESLANLVAELHLAELLKDAYEVAYPPSSGKEST